MIEKNSIPVDQQAPAGVYQPRPDEVGDPSLLIDWASELNATAGVMGVKNEKPSELTVRSSSEYIASMARERKAREEDLVASGVDRDEILAILNEEFPNE